MNTNPQKKRSSYSHDSHLPSVSENCRPSSSRSASHGKANAAVMEPPLPTSLEDMLRSSKSPPKLDLGSVEQTLHILSTFYNAISQARCPTCKQRLLKALNIDEHVNTWASKARRRRSSKHAQKCLSYVTCSSCRVGVCLGCWVAKPNYTDSVASGEYMIHLCCEAGRLVSLWIILCWTDDRANQQMEKEQRSSKGKQRANGPSLDGQHHTNGPFYGSPYLESEKRAKGTGYAHGAPQSALIYGGYFSPLDGQQILKLKNADHKTDNRNEDLFMLLAGHIPRSSSECAQSISSQAASTVSAFFQLSSILNILAAVLRNDSVDDAVKRRKIYLAGLELVERLVDHPTTAALVVEPRMAKEESAGLRAISADKGRNSLVLSSSKDANPSSIASIMESFGVQARTLIGAADFMRQEFKDSEGKLQLDFCKRIDKVINKLPQSARNSSKPFGKAASLTTATQQWNDYQKYQKVAIVSDQLIVPDILIHPRFEDNYGQPKPGRMRQLVKEVASMMTSLPDGIFLRVAESRPDHIKAAIFGRECTLYHGAMFEFDVFCGMGYPNQPPSVMCRLNPAVSFIAPNIHPDGEVCLSLLGTWHGDAGETWQPGVSTLYQVLVSIQTFILGENPIENIPVAVNTDGTDLMYLLEASVLYGYMICGFNRQRSDERVMTLWGKVFRKYYAANGEKILQKLRLRSKENLWLNRYEDEMMLRPEMQPRIPVGMDMVHSFEKKLKAYLNSTKSK